MKKFLCILFATVALLSVSTVASAQLKWGLKAGLNLTNPSQEALGASLKGKTGWFAGPMAEFTIPIIGLGVDGSLLYSQVNNKLSNDMNSRTLRLHYIDIPINLKYTIGLGSLAAVFIAAGPQFSFNVTGNSIDDAYNAVVGHDPDGDAQNFEASINAGVGVKLLKKLQIYGGYNFALGDSFKFKNVVNAVGDVVTGSGKNNMWKVSVAYMF